MTMLKNGTTVEDSRLGRVPPEDWKHVEKYPIRALPVEVRPVAIPVGIGVNWYRAFYAEYLIKRFRGARVEYWVREGDLGPLEGGHGITLEPFSGPHRDVIGWWSWHDQISEGICISEMVARIGALLNRKRFQPRPVYDAAQKVDYWGGEEPTYSGTSADAGFRIMREQGLVPAKRGEKHLVVKNAVTRPFVASEGIAANRWARDDNDIFYTLGDVDAEYAVWLNSWGTDYPHRVYVPRSVISRLHREDGEVGIVTDR